MKARFRRNHISVVNTPDGRIEDVGEIKREVRNFFKSNFKEDNWVRPILRGVEFVNLYVVYNKSLEETSVKLRLKQLSGVVMGIKFLVPTILALASCKIVGDWSRRM